MEAADGGETEFLLDNRHLYLRTGRMTDMLKIRSSVFGAIHSYFRGRDFTEYQAPNFVAGAVEGGSTLFEVPYFGRKAYLTQSWQLYAEAAMPALERLYTIAPSFRAEKSRTRRHLTEFWHAEMEVAWASNAEIMSHGEGLVRHIAKTVLDEREAELNSIDRDLDLLARYADNPYPRMRYDEAVETLQGMGIEIEWGQDLDYSKEKVLTQDFEVPHFLTHYPKIAKPFYHRVDPDDGNYVLCHDLLAPEGYGEIIGGGERTWSEEEILARIDEEGVPRSLTNSTLIHAHMEEFHTVDSDWVWTECVLGYLEQTTSEKSYHSQGTLEELPLDFLLYCVEDIEQITTPDRHFCNCNWFFIPRIEANRQLALLEHPNVTSTIPYRDCSLFGNVESSL